VPFLEAISAWLTNEPTEIILIIPEPNKASLDTTIKSISPTKKSTEISILTNGPSPSKRQQLSLGITSARGNILVLTDSDVLWQPSLLPYLLAAFQDPSVGDVGSLTKILRNSSISAATIPESIMHRLFAQRYQQLAAMSVADETLTCLSGRTAAYRSPILQNASFIHQFTHDFWRGDQLSDSGDDAFITRWVQERGWKAVLQVAREATVSTWASVSTGKLARQWVRWTRNSKRSSWRYLAEGRKLAR
jgi:cellulose synthase/poly-beta-1,6-N-acetylglucosamine synthase-like glycosyltransferase